MKRIIAAVLAAAAAAAWATVLTQTTTVIRAYKGSYTIGPAFTSELACEAYLKTQAIATYKCRKDTTYKLTADPVVVPPAGLSYPLPIATVPVPVSAVAPVTSGSVTLISMSATDWEVTVVGQSTARINVFTQPSADPEFDWTQQTVVGALPAGTLKFKIPKADNKWLRIGAENSMGYAPAKSAPVPLGAVVVPPPPPPPPTGGTIPTMASVSAAAPFSGMPGNVQMLGYSPPLNTIPEAGITGSGTVNGSNVRFGKFADPKSTRQVIRVGLRNTDPETGAGVRRVDVVTGTRFVPDVDYWTAFEVYIPAATFNANDDASISNIHSDSNTVSANWAFQINRGVIKFVPVSNQASPTPAGQVVQWIPIPLSAWGPDQWVKVVLKWRINWQGNGSYTKVWANGVQVIDFTGPLGINVAGNYGKFGYYNWAFNATVPEREVLFRSYHYVRDAGYTLAQVTALLQ